MAASIIPMNHLQQNNNLLYFWHIFDYQYFLNYSWWINNPDGTHYLVFFIRNSSKILLEFQQKIWLRFRNWVRLFSMALKYKMSTKLAYKIHEWNFWLPRNRSFWSNWAGRMRSLMIVRTSLGFILLASWYSAFSNCIPTKNE